MTYGFVCLLEMTLTVLVRLVAPLFDESGVVTLLQRTGELQGGLIALLPVVFLVGLLTGSFGRTGELLEYFARVGPEATAAELDAAVARATGLPGCRVVYAAETGEAFVTVDGAAVPPAPDERLYPVRYGSTAVGALLYPMTGDVDLRLLQAVAQASAPVVGYRRTTAGLRAAMLELRRTDRALRQSRRRIALAGDVERRRIARDLHDGLQQQAIVLGMRAQQLTLAGPDPSAVAAAAAAVRDGVGQLLTQTRDLVQGILPAPLVERGVPSAVRALSARMPIPVDVQVQGSPRRLPAEIESTVYFVVAEGITNAVKHARATGIRVELAVGDDQVVAEVRDDGIGGAQLGDADRPGGGSGLVGVRDRLAAFGGRLVVESEPGRGTRLRMSVPRG